MEKHIDGWWFSEGMILPHGDGRRIEIGVTHKVEGEIVPCERGLHMSVRAIDALRYAPGNIVWKVRGSGVIVPHADDKHACSERTYLAGGIDVFDTLRKFVRRCALDVIHMWNAPDVVQRYLRTGDESLRDAAWAAARDAARVAARDAAWDAAWAAARDAAWAATRDAARVAARAAAWDAARDAARAAAWAAAWDATRDAARAAAWAATRDAARVAARDAQNRRLTRMFNAALKAAKEG